MKPSTGTVIQGWAAFSRSRHILWTTIRPTRAETIARFEQVNPSVDGEPRTSTSFHPIRIILDPHHS
jgi:hypothetical protein